MSVALVRYEALPGGTLFQRRGLLADLERTLHALEREYEGDVERIRLFEKRFRPAVGRRHEELERLREKINRGWEALAAAQGQEESADESEASETGTPRDATRRPGGHARRLFLAIARQIHPDLAPDEAERRRRHEVMAEATLAYRNDDHRRLQWLLEHWLAERNPILGLDPGAAWARTNRQIAWARYRIREMRHSIEQLHSSPMARIMQQHEHARTGGRNLILEMRRQVQAELEDAFRDLDRLRDAVAELPEGLRGMIESKCGLWG